MSDSRQFRSLGTLVLLIAAAAPLFIAEAQVTKRPMTFMDVQLMRQAGSPTPSPKSWSLRWLRRHE